RRRRRTEHAGTTQRGHQTSTRQRLLRSSPRARLPLRDDLRVLLDVLHHHRPPRHHPGPARQRRRTRPPPPPRRLRHPPQQARRHPRLTPITHINRGPAKNRVVLAQPLVLRLQAFDLG